MAIVVAGSPNLWVIDGLLWSEGLAAVLVVACMLCALRLRDRATVKRACALGVFGGLAALTRAEALLLVPLLGVPVVLSHRQQLARKEMGVLLMAMTLSLGVVVAPWTLRNLETFSRPVLLSTNAEAVIGVANCTRTYYEPSGNGEEGD